MKILAIDTSNLNLGVAILDNGIVVGEIITYIQKNHSIRLMPAITNLMNEVGIKPGELDRIVVAKGPGSYTGVRIGVTTAKTLAWSLNIPIVGISSLALLAQNGTFFDGVISPLFDARRGQVYTGLYESKSRTLVQVKDDRNILLTDWLDMLKDTGKNVLFLGNDVSIHQKVVKEILGNTAIIAPLSMNNPRPSELAVLGMNYDPEEIHSFVPNYIRLAEAEVNWLKKQES